MEDCIDGSGVAGLVEAGRFLKKGEGFFFLFTKIAFLSFLFFKRFLVGVSSPGVRVVWL